MNTMTNINMESTIGLQSLKSRVTSITASVFTPDSTITKAGLLIRKKNENNWRSVYCTVDQHVFRCHLTGLGVRYKKIPLKNLQVCKLGNRLELTNPLKNNQVYVFYAKDAEEAEDWYNCLIQSRSTRNKSEESININNIIQSAPEEEIRSTILVINEDGEVDSMSLEEVELISQFINIALRSSAEDARFYLEENQWNVRKAVQQFIQDTAWIQDLDHNDLSQPVC
eukprot:TRINITY_DN11396_c0_g1_i1.p1 TRINITY_DN11396_c0_g1~~TRINITY_DN11396_c0_g1_i1.p1  ORF type:complete len:226 (+),score=58.49 TRINITY_DN11396_c0_g1_i1:50-727(+)